jgi:hypothetical protein
MKIVFFFIRSYTGVHHVCVCECPCPVFCNLCSSVFLNESYSVFFSFFYFCYIATKEGLDINLFVVFFSFSLRLFSIFDLLNVALTLFMMTMTNFSHVIIESLYTNEHEKRRIEPFFCLHPCNNGIEQR